MFVRREMFYILVLVRGMTCYQEVVPLIPHLSARNRHQGLYQGP